MNVENQYMTFKDAMTALKNGHSIARLAWKKKKELCRAHSVPDTVCLMVEQCPGLKSMAQQSSVNAVPSILEDADRLANDWYITTFLEQMQTPI